MREGLSYAWEALKDTSELARSLCPKAHPVRPRPGRMYYRGVADAAAELPSARRLFP